MKKSIACFLSFALLFPSASLAQEGGSGDADIFGDGWRIVIIDGVNYLQFEESVAVSILAQLEQNEMRRVELQKSLQNQRSLELALGDSKSEAKTWRILFWALSAVTAGLLGALVLN